MEFTEKYNEVLADLTKLEQMKYKANSDVRLAYDYKEHLITKMTFANKQIEQKQNELHKILLAIQDSVARLKVEFDLYVCAVSS